MKTHTSPHPQLMKQLLEQVPCGVITTDEKLRITSFNRVAQQLTGWTSEEALGKRCTEIMNPAVANEMCPLQLAHQTGTSIEDAVIQIRNRTGTLVPIHISVSLLKNEQGEITGTLETFGDLSTIYSLRQKLGESFSFHQIISNNRTMKKLFNVLPRMAESGSTILIRGESGTGKKLFARAVHSLSARKSKRFVSINFSLLPESLLEAELFGFVKGAFPNVRSGREGAITAAEGGTLFLDGIAETTHATQMKLLRLLQDGAFEPIGSSKTQFANVRVIASTQANLEKLVEQGAFRAELYYRLNVLTLEIPPLRDRLDDVPLLVDHFLANWSSVNGLPVSPYTAPALQLLMRYPFPGNVIELENTVERCAVMSGGAPIDVDTLPLQIVNHRTGLYRASTDSVLAQTQNNRLLQMENEQKLLQATLIRNQGNRSKAAKELGISRATLWRKLNRVGSSS